MTGPAPGPEKPQKQGGGLGLFELLWLAWLDFLHIIQQLKFGIFLILVLAVLVLIGAAVPQSVFGDGPEVYLEAYTPEQYKWILLLGLDRIYKTGYFLALLALLLISVTLCAFGRLEAARKLAANTKPHASRHALENARFHGYQDVEGKGVDDIIASLKKQYYTVYSRIGDDGATQLLMRRGLTAKWANVAMHFSFIVLAAGALIGIMSQVKETTAIIGEGEVYVHPDTGQRIRLAEYYHEYNPRHFLTDMDFFVKQFPTDFKSHLQVLDEEGKVIQERIIRVNDPLIHDHVKYYQSSFAQIPELRIQGAGIDTVIVPMLEELTPYPFLPKPIIVKRQGSVAGGYWLNPDGTRGERLPFRVVINEGRPIPGDALGRFRIFPYQELSGGTGILVEGEPQTVPGPDGQPVTITLKGVREATILQVKRDRGVGIVYFAFNVCVFGILYPLFFPYHDARMVLQPVGNGVRVWWGTRYRAGRRALTRFEKLWRGESPRDAEDDLVGDFAV